MKFVLRALLLSAATCLLLVYLSLGNDKSLLKLNDPVAGSGDMMESSLSFLTNTRVQTRVPIVKPALMNHSARINLAVVACGERLNETMVMLKSSTLLTQVPLHFVIVAEKNLIPQFGQMLEAWPKEVKQRITYEVLPITFPVDGNRGEWKQLFKPCAAQRLFLPSLLKNIDSLLYVDTDILFLVPVEEIWQHFSKMNSTQMAALTPEHEDYATGWYNRFAKHPYFEPLGVNSGVMLMNLTRMRRFGWREYVIPIHQKYKLKITWGDQDIINIIFHYHPDKLYIYPCRYNFRPDHCMYNSVCKSAEEDGVAVLHGNRGSFHNDKQIAFKAVYRAMEEFELGSDLRHLWTKLQKYLKETEGTNCGKVHHMFLREFEKYFHSRNSSR